MQKYLICVVFILFIFNSCATKTPVVHKRMFPEKETYEKDTRETERPRPSRLELLIQRIKLNGNDIEKFYVLDDKGVPVVRAFIANESGPFEIVYDLDNVEPLGDNSYNVPFVLREYGTEAFIKNSLIWKPVGKKAGLLLSLDDRFLESWEYYFDLFDKYNVRITFFVQGDFTSFGGRAIKRGHDVGYHSLNHLDLREVSEEKLANEALEPLDDFKDQGLYLSSFAFPFGFSNERIRNILSGSFKILRGYGTTFRIYSEDEIRAGFIISKAIDNVVIPADTDYKRLINIMLRTLKFLDNNKVLPLTTHDISDSHWAITPARLEYLLKTAADLDLPFYRYSDFVK